MAQDYKASQTVIRKDDQFYVTFVTFEVEGLLFRVPRRPFDDSVVLRTEDGQSRESGDESPIILEGISAHEFRQLLRVIFPSSTKPKRDDLSVSEWVSALKLCTTWKLEAIRELCIDKLTVLPIDASERFIIARDYDVPKWVLPTLNDVARRQKPLDVEDVDKFGLDWTLKIAAVRECVKGGVHCVTSTGVWDLQRPACYQFVLDGAVNAERSSIEYVDFVPRIKEVFALK